MAQRIILKRCLSKAPLSSSSSSNPIRAVGVRGGSSSIVKSTIQTTTHRHFNNIAQSLSTFTLHLNKNEATATSTATGAGISEATPISQKQRQLQWLQYRNKSFQSTNVLYSDEKPETTPKDGGGDDDDEVPMYQNPLHHNDPNKNKIMLEDYAEGETPPIVPLPPFDDGSGKTIAAPELHNLAEEILTLNMFEMKELVDRVADHFELEDNDDDMLVGGGGGGGGPAAEEEVKEEKTAFDLKLTGFDAKSKIKVIKEVRAMTGLGLKEAKEMVEGAPKVVKKDIKKEEAEELKAKLEAVGATVDIE